MKQELDGTKWNIWHKRDEYKHMLAQSSDEECCHEDTEKIDREFVRESLYPPLGEEEPEHIHQKWGLGQTYQADKEENEPEHL